MCGLFDKRSLHVCLLGTWSTRRYIFKVLSRTGLVEMALWFSGSIKEG